MPARCHGPGGEGRLGAGRLTISVGFQGGCLDETDVGRALLVLLDELRADGARVTGVAVQVDGLPHPPRHAR